MIVHVETAGPFQQNGFVVGCDKTGEAVVIDPGDGVEALLDFASRRSLAIRHILLTHAHVDHVTGVGAAKRALVVPVHLHRDEVPDDAEAVVRVSVKSARGGWIAAFNLQP